MYNTTLLSFRMMVPFSIPYLNRHCDTWTTSLSCVIVPVLLLLLQASSGFFCMCAYRWLGERDWWWWCSREEEKKMREKLLSSSSFFFYFFFLLAALFRSHLIDAIFDDDVLSLSSLSLLAVGFYLLVESTHNDLWFDKDGEEEKTRERENETR